MDQLQWCSKKKMMISRMCLLKARRHTSHHHPNSPNTPMTTTRKILYPTTHYLRCNFHHLMVTTPRSGLITVKTTSPFIPSLRNFGLLQRQCICKETQPGGTKLTSKLIWKELCVALQAKFGSDDYRSGISDMLSLRQTGTVEEYCRCEK